MDGWAFNGYCYFWRHPPPGISCAPGSRGGRKPPTALSSSSAISGRWASTLKTPSISIGRRKIPTGRRCTSVTWACAFWGQPACISAGATAESTGSIVTRSGLPPCSVQARYFISLSLPTTCTIYTTPGSASPDGATACCSTPSPCCPMGALSMPILLCSG